MNRAMTKNKTHTGMIITSQQTVCGLDWTYHGELHPAFFGTGNDH